MHAYVLTVDFLSSGVQVARHGHHRRFTGYALPTAGGLTCGDGQLVDCLRCVAVCAWARRFSTSNLEIYSRSRADLDLEPRAEQQLVGLQTAETGTFRHVRSKHGAYEFLGHPHRDAPGGCRAGVPRARTESELNLMQDQRGTHLWEYGG